jgi:hypothetical protein
MSEKLVDTLMLYLVFQPNVCTDEYSFAFRCMEEVANQKKNTSLFTFLGDLLDRNLYGRSSCSCFEQRIEYYVKADNISRIVSVLMLVHQKIQDIELKKKLELSIIENFKRKESYTVADFRILLRYSSMGITHPLSPAFKNYSFPDVVAQGIF